MMLRVIARAVLVIVTLFVTVFVLAQANVLSTRDKIVAVEHLKPAQAVIVPGASVLRDGTPSDILEDRLLTALEVYESGKADKILVSGDNGQNDYDEVNAMKAFLLKQDVAPEDLFLDHAGFDTYDTMYRAQAIFGAESVIVTTQAYHLPRALYIGRELGLEVQGVAADRQRYRGMTSFKLRETLANVKAFIDVLVRSQSKFLGEQISIEGDGQATWD